MPTFRSFYGPKPKQQEISSVVYQTFIFTWFLILISQMELFSVLLKCLLFTRKKKKSLVLHSGSCEFILFLSSHLPVLSPLAIDTYFVVYYHGEWKYFLEPLKALLMPHSCQVNFLLPFSMCVTCSRHLNFPLLHTAPLLIHCALTGLLSRLNSADYWICTNYTPKILKLIPNIILPQKDLPISGIKDLGGK